MDNIVKCERHNTVRDATEEPCWGCEKERERPDHTVRVSGGKYTFIVRDLHIVIDRHGEQWHAQQDAFNALHSIMCELDAARVVLEAARSLAKNNEAPPVLYAALMKHRALVDDQEKPSEWAGVP